MEAPHSFWKDSDWREGEQRLGSLLLTFHWWLQDQLPGGWSSAERSNGQAEKEYWSALTQMGFLSYVFIVDLQKTEQTDSFSVLCNL